MLEARGEGGRLRAPRPCPALAGRRTAPCCRRRSSSRSDRDRHAWLRPALRATSSTAASTGPRRRRAATTSQMRQRRLPQAAAHLAELEASNALRISSSTSSLPRREIAHVSGCLLSGFYRYAAHYTHVAAASADGERRVTLMQRDSLGTMGWMPSERRETTCFACRDGDSLLHLRRGHRPAPPARTRPGGAARRRPRRPPVPHALPPGPHLRPRVPARRAAGPRARDPRRRRPRLTGVDPERRSPGCCASPYNPRDWEELDADQPGARLAGANEVAGHDGARARASSTRT